MYYAIDFQVKGYCPDLDLESNFENCHILVSEDLRDALPYLYEKHFDVPYKELGWWLEPGAREWMKEMEDKWMHNQLDLTEVYKDSEFLASLSDKYADYSSVDIDTLRDEFEDEIRDELYSLSNDELRDLYEYSDSVDYTIEDSSGNVLASGYVDLPELDEEEDDD